MPTKLLFASQRAGQRGRRSDPQPQVTRGAALLAAAAAILVSVPSDRIIGAVVPIASVPATPPATEAKPAEPASPVRHLAGLPSNVDSLVAALAHKYRVSAEATREMVHAAYVEAARNGLDPLLIIAVIAVESRFNPIAQSDGGALGLMQVIPRYHSDKLDAAAGESMLDPRVNIQVGAAVLKDYIRRGGTEIVGLQLYNGALDDETSAYAHRVLAEKQRLKSMIGRGA